MTRPPVWEPEESFRPSILIHKVGTGPNAFAVDDEGKFAASPGEGDIAVVRPTDKYDRLAPQRRIVDAMQHKRKKPKKKKKEEITPNVTPTWYLRGTGGSRITTMANIDKQNRFDRWYYYDNQFYFGPDQDGYGPEGSAYGSYFDSLLALNIENYFRKGSLSASPGAWNGNLNIQSFYPYNSPVAFIVDPPLQTSNIITNRTAGRGNWTHEYGALDHVVDWNAKYVIGIAGQASQFAQEVAWIDPDDTTHFWDSLEVSGQLLSVHRATGKPFATYPLGFRIIYHSQKGYWNVEDDGSGNAFFTFRGGPYRTVTYNVPMLTSGGTVIIMQYQQHDWIYGDIKPGNTPHTHAPTRVNWARIKFYRTDANFASWVEFVPQGLEGLLSWEYQSPDGVRTQFVDLFTPHGLFVFLFPLDADGGRLQMLCAPWIYKGRLHIRTLTWPYKSHQAGVYTSGKRVDRYTFPTIINSYDLLGKDPKVVRVTDRKPNSYPSDWNMYLISGYYGAVDDDPRLFAGDDNCMLAKTGKPTKATY
jgi:hypothetical protein